MDYRTAILMVVMGNVAYQLNQKFIKTTVDPMVSVMATYLAGLIGVFIVWKATGSGKELFSSFTQLNWASYVLGLTMIVIDCGYILVYRTGAQLSVVAVLYNVVPIVLLFMIGVFFFQDTVSVRNVLGVILATIGMLLVSWK